MKKITQKICLVLFVICFSFFYFSCQDSNDNDSLEEVYQTIFKDVDIKNVTEDLNFPTKIDEVIIVWETSNPDVLTNEGKVTRGLEDVKVIVEAKLTLGEESKNFTSIFTIKALELSEKTDDEYLSDASKELLKNIDLENVTSNLNLITKIGNINITWSSNNQQVLSNLGNVTRGETDVIVELKAMLTLNEASKEVKFICVVKAVETNNVNEEYINEVYQNIIKNINCDAVTTNLNLVTNIVGVNVKWTSDNTNVISNDGKVTRGNVDVIVTFNVELTYKDTTINKELVLKVLKLENSGNLEDEIITTAKEALVAKTGQKVIIEGEVTDIYRKWSDSYKNISVYITDKTGTILAYNITKKVEVGYIIKVEGTIGVYNNKNQIVDGVTTIISTTINNDVMEDQIVTPGSSDEVLEDVLNRVDAVGLPSTGSYDVLVVPVEFTNYLISDEDLNKLELAFNDKEGLTGWESVSSYYNKASYGKLDLNFEICDIYKTNRKASYYSNLQNGSEDILLEVLASLEKKYDLTNYDYNNDGIIDGVYLIYSAPVDYDDGDFYWAYVSWYITDEYNNKTFDGLDAYYYLFAGFDFMDEDASESVDGFEYNGYIDGLKINAVTYIHETGHMLGLDDYYDYDTSRGSNEGVGCADMMDYNVGDHSVYSKTILGWIKPKIVTETQTITIGNLESTGDAIMVLLDSNGSYFSEYLLIDLYSNTGLNNLHSEVNYSYLYDGAKSGVRIYHVSSKVDNPFSDDYQSITDYNNTYTDIPLLKLLEADGDDNFNSSEGYAMDTDLWQAGDVFSDVFSGYTRNDGKRINFDIEVVNCNSTFATITITFIN